MTMERDIQQPSDRQRKPNQYKCVVVGDGAVGKTSMLVRFVQGDFLTQYSPTHFDSFTITLPSGRDCTPCIMVLVDTAGQETYDRLRALTYYDTDVFILCFSVMDPDSFENVKTRWVPELKEFKPNTPIILVGTQTDLRNNSAERSENASNPDLYVSSKEGKRLANKIHARMYAECSALTGEGLDSIFHQAILTVDGPKRKKGFWHSFKKMFATA